jgi:hypothetical protein
MFARKQCRDDRQDAAHHTTSPKQMLASISTFMNSTLTADHGLTLTCLRLLFKEVRTGFPRICQLQEEIDLPLQTSAARLPMAPPLHIHPQLDRTNRKLNVAPCHKPQMLLNTRVILR